MFATVRTRQESRVTLEAVAASLQCSIVPSFHRSIARPRRAARRSRQRKFMSGLQVSRQSNQGATAKPQRAAKTCAVGIRRR